MLMVERLLPSDDPVAEEVLEWTIKRDAEDITQLMEWLAGTSARTVSYTHLTLPTIYSE